MTATIAMPVKSGKGSAIVWDSIWKVAEERGLQVGDQLPSIRELAERLDVKQTVVRDALLKAESMGFVTVLPRAGAFLRASASTPKTVTRSLDASLHSALAHDEHNLFHLLDARRLIEIELVGRTAERRRLEDLLPVRRALDEMLHLPPEATRAEHVDCDIRFHVEIARLAGNLALFVVQRTLMELLRPHLNEVPRGLERRAIADRSHLAIYEMLVSGDVEKARTVMRDHLSLAYDGMLRDIQVLPAVGAGPMPS